MSVYKRGIGDQGISHFPKKFVTLYASAACTEGYFVSIDGGDSTNGLGGSVRNAELGASNQGNALTIGVATHSAAAGEEVVVQVAGKYENAFVNASCDEGLPMTGPIAGETIGQTSMLAETTFGAVIAVGLEADTGNLADVMIVNQGFF